MNKVFMIAIVGLLLVGVVGGYIYFNLPEQLLIFETIEPQIICLGDIC